MPELKQENIMAAAGFTVELSRQEKLVCNSLLSKARKAQKSGRLAESLSQYRKLFIIIKDTPKAASIQAKIDSITEKLGCQTERGLQVRPELYKILLPHQKTGLDFLYSLFKNGTGGLLADDMGLGKTLQTVALIDSLYLANEIRMVLIIVPLPIVCCWVDEFAKRSIVQTHVYEGASKEKRNRDLLQLTRNMKRRGVVIITYGLAERNLDVLLDNQLGGYPFVWDIVVCDEIHHIKNINTKQAKALRLINSKVRIGLSGTPIQNNLLEFWAIMDYTCKGQIFGSRTAFKTEFATPINEGRLKDATEEQQARSKRTNEEMFELLEPVFLAREKNLALRKTTQSTVETEIPSEDGLVVRGFFSLPQKIELVVWTHASNNQQKSFYEMFLSNNEFQSANFFTRAGNHVFLAIRTLRAIVLHPSIPKKDLIGEPTCDIVELLDRLPVSDILSQSGKLMFLSELLPNLRRAGHRVLLFSQSLQFLTLLEALLKDMGVDYVRVDGSTNKKHRPRLIDLFNDDDSIFAFIGTTQSTGQGITLTGADRVVICDPSWNQAKDNQAVDRAYRIGQERTVVVYRLITCGTVEEKIYRRQIFKHSFHEIVVERKDAPPIFSNNDLRDLFTAGDLGRSETQEILEEFHERCHNSGDIQVHIDNIISLNSVAGVSRHDILQKLTPADVKAAVLKMEPLMSKPAIAWTSQISTNKSKREYINNESINDDDMSEDSIGIEGQLELEDTYFLERSPVRSTIRVSPTSSTPLYFRMEKTYTKNTSIDLLSDSDGQDGYIKYEASEKRREPGSESLSGDVLPRSRLRKLQTKPKLKAIHCRSRVALVQSIPNSSTLVTISDSDSGESEEKDEIGGTDIKEENTYESVQESTSNSLYLPRSPWYSDDDENDIEILCSRQRKKLPTILSDSSSGTDESDGHKVAIQTRTRFKGPGPKPVTLFDHVTNEEDRGFHGVKALEAPSICVAGLSVLDKSSCNEDMTSICVAGSSVLDKSSCNEDMDLGHYTTNFGHVCSTREKNELTYTQSDKHMSYELRSANNTDYDSLVSTKVLVEVNECQAASRSQTHTACTHKPLDVYASDINMCIVNSTIIDTKTADVPAPALSNLTGNRKLHINDHADICKSDYIHPTAYPNNTQVHVPQSKQANTKFQYYAIHKDDSTRTAIQNVTESTNGDPQADAQLLPYAITLQQPSTPTSPAWFAARVEDFKECLKEGGVCARANILNDSTLANIDEDRKSTSLYGSIGQSTDLPMSMHSSLNQDVLSSLNQDGLENRKSIDQNTSLHVDMNLDKDVESTDTTNYSTDQVCGDLVRERDEQASAETAIWENSRSRSDCSRAHERKAIVVIDISDDDEHIHSPLSSLHSSILSSPPGNYSNFANSYVLSKRSEHIIPHNEMKTMHNISGIYAKENVSKCERTDTHVLVSPHTKFFSLECSTSNSKFSEESHVDLEEGTNLGEAEELETNTLAVAIKSGGDVQIVSDGDTYPAVTNSSTEKSRIYTSLTPIKETSTVLVSTLVQTSHSLKDSVSFQLTDDHIRSDKTPTAASISTFCDRLPDLHRNCHTHMPSLVQTPKLTPSATVETQLGSIVQLCTPMSKRIPNEIGPVNIWTPQDELPAEDMSDIMGSLNRISFGDKQPISFSSDDENDQVSLEDDVVDEQSSDYKVNDDWKLSTPASDESSEDDFEDVLKRLATPVPVKEKPQKKGEVIIVDDEYVSSSDESSHIVSGNENVSTDSEINFLGRGRRRPSTGFSGLNPNHRSPNRKKEKRFHKQHLQAKASELYKHINKIAFDGVLPDDLPVIWSKHLRKTAGKTFLKKIITNPTGYTYAASISLAVKVVDSEKKLLCTLAHEMCHAAAWIIDNVAKPPHGSAFRAWANKCESSIPSLKITTCHKYDIQYKYWYQCVSDECSKRFGRHSKSIDLMQMVCGKCSSRLKLLDNLKIDGTPMKARKPNKYMIFVKENMKTFKSRHPDLPHTELMRLIATDYRKDQTRNISQQNNDIGRINSPTGVSLQ
eukprot:CFRG1346T1